MLDFFLTRKNNEKELLTEAKYKNCEVQASMLTKKGTRIQESGLLRKRHGSTEKREESYFIHQFSEESWHTLSRKGHTQAGTATHTDFLTQSSEGKADSPTAGRHTQPGRES